MPKLCAQKAAQEAKERKLQMPPASSDGRHPTLSDSDGNRFGAVTTDSMDKELSEFARIASTPDAKVLEIGAAYGSPYLMQAFKSETTAGYTATDILGDQLRILANRIEETYPNKLKSHLSLVAGAFPQNEVIDQLQIGGYDAILSSSTFHFFTDDEALEAFRQVYRLLKPGGKFFAKLPTPYSGLFDASFVQKISKEIQDFADHFDEKKRPIPGFIANPKTVLNSSISENLLDEIGFTRVKHLFMFDKKITKIFLKREGFKTELCDYKPRLSPPYYCDGREYLIVVAQK